jgi:hypothetical protein
MLRKTMSAFVLLTVVVTLLVAWRIPGGFGGPPARGDANGDGRIDARDAAVILQYNAGLLVFIRYPEEWDVSGDGAVDSRDATLVLQYSAGLIDRFPA